MASGLNIVYPHVLNSLSALEKEIYQCLQNNSPKKAIDVARGVNKMAAKDVNPSLYKMKKLGLLHYQEETKLWRCSNGAAAEISKEATVSKAMAAPEQSDLQEKILAFLSNNKPQRAIALARVLKKTSARDVNPLLYKMKDMNLLNYDSDARLWSVTPEDGAAGKTASAGRQTDDPTKSAKKDNEVNVTHNIYIYNPAHVQLGNVNTINHHPGELLAELSCVDEADLNDDCGSGEGLGQSHSDGVSQTVRVPFSDWDLSCVGNCSDMKVTHETDSWKY